MSQLQVAHMPERAVSKQWAKIERLLTQGTDTYTLTKELKKLDLICDRTIKIFREELGEGNWLNERTMRVLRTGIQATDLLNRMHRTENV